MNRTIRILAVMMIHSWIIPAQINPLHILTLLAIHNPAEPTHSHNYTLSTPFTRTPQTQHAQTPHKMPRYSKHNVSGRQSYTHNRHGKK